MGLHRKCCHPLLYVYYEYENENAAWNRVPNGPLDIWNPQWHLLFLFARNFG